MGEEAAVDVLIDLPGVWTAPDLPWPARAAAVVAGITGAPVAERAATYFTDASVLTPALGGVPTLILGPGEPTQAHKVDEWCAVARIEEAVAIYRALIKDWTERRERA
jgi:succinyl-diaminopimelate desuccinylase